MVVVVFRYAEVTVEEVRDGLGLVPGVGFVVRGESRGGCSDWGIVEELQDCLEIHVVYFDASRWSLWW